MTGDVWMQHPTQRLLSNDMFASLRRWMGDESPASGSGPSLRGECPQPTDEIPLDTTLAAMDTAGIDVGLLSAWHGPNGLDLISNDEVANWVRLHPNRFKGRRCAEARARLRRHVGLLDLCSAVRVRFVHDRPARST